MDNLTKVLVDFADKLRHKDEGEHYDYASIKKEADQAHDAIMGMVLSEEEIYEILITTLPIREYFAIPSYKLKRLAHTIRQAMLDKIGGER